MPLPKGVFPVRKPSGKVYWYHQDRRGKPDKGPLTRLPEFGTPEFWSEIAKLSGATQKTNDTVRVLIEAYKLKINLADKPKNTQTTYETAFRRIEEAWGNLAVCDISVSGVLGLIELFNDRPSMGNMVLGRVKDLMKFAVQKGLRTDNPAREIDKLEESPDGAKPITIEAWTALIGEKAPEALRRLAHLGRMTGQRISDLINMRPADRDQDGIVCAITKIRVEEHWCPLTQDQRSILDGWKQFGNLPYISKTDGKRHSDATLRYLWNEFIETEAGAALRGFTPHDLRATKVCDERISGKSHQQIAAMVGMSTEMVMRYSKHIDQRLAAKGNGGGT